MLQFRMASETSFFNFLKGALAGLLVLVFLGLTGPQVAEAQSGVVPGGVSGNSSDAEYWRSVRYGIQGQVSIPDKKAGVLVQSQGEEFRNFRKQKIFKYGAYSLGGIIAVLILFYAIRGRIRVDSGLSGRTILRFNFIERFAHWLTAGSFVVLGLTGLNILYGKYVLLPILGPEIFATLTLGGKYAHNFLGFAFMVGILLMLVLWVKDNIPGLLDLKWLAVGGGLFTKGLHPPAKKFNAGQKLIFWSVVLLGGSLSVSGLAMIFPFEINLFAGTFKILNLLGLGLPTELTALQETQLAVLWHSIVAILMIVIIIGHIYIGSVGMEGAIAAVTSGEVDENWAREHHSIWYKEKTSSHHAVTGSGD